MTSSRRDRSGRAADALVLCALVLVVAMAAFLIAAPAAQAEDTFYLRNETGERLIPNEPDELEENCWFDATGVLDPDEPGSAAPLSSITAEEHVFECVSGWGANISYRVPPHWHVEHREHTLVGGGNVGAIGFFARDPLIGDATLLCQALGEEWDEGNGFIPIEEFMTAEVDGLTCTISWLPGVNASTPLDLTSASLRAYAGHVRLVDSLAPVVGREAKVRVQVFGLGNARHRVTVTLRDQAGQPIGTGSRFLPVGDRSHMITVALSPATVRELDSRHELRVKAAVDIASQGGTGDKTTQLLLRRVSAP